MADLTALALNSVHTLSVAEIHGVVCGLAIWQVESFDLRELVELVGADELTEEFSVEAFVNASVEALTAEDISFTPLLPDESDAEGAIELRLEALAEWCAGFLAGFGAAGTVRGLNSLDELPEEVQELMGDLSAITEIDVEGYADSGDTDMEDGESDLVQIEEFVKVGVLLILSLITQPSEQHPGHPADENPDEEWH
jgi:uncharacterized protein YgfB (UPF0149 family)